MHSRPYTDHGLTLIKCRNVYKISNGQEDKRRWIKIGRFDHEGSLLAQKIKNNDRRATLEQTSTKTYRRTHPFSRLCVINFEVGDRQPFFRIHIRETLETSFIWPKSAALRLQWKIFTFFIIDNKLVAQ